jgi:hypothetical protein
MTEEQTEYKTESQSLGASENGGSTEELDQTKYKTPDMKGVLARARKIMLRNALVKVKEGKILSAKEVELIEEAEAEAEVGGQRSEVGSKETFKNLREVIAYLHGQGWKVSQSTLYKHQGEGKIKSEPDGTYVLKSILRYAKAYLTTREAKRKLDDEELQRKKTLAEINRIVELGKLARIKRMTEEGKYIIREQFELEVAARAAALEAALLFVVQSRVGNWIRIVAGDFHKTQDLINDVQEAVNDALNEFASEKEFHVLFDNLPREEKEDVSHRVTENTEIKESHDEDDDN